MANNLRVYCHNLLLFCQIFPPERGEMLTLKFIVDFPFSSLLARLGISIPKEFVTDSKYYSTDRQRISTHKLKRPNRWRSHQTVTLEDE